MKASSESVLDKHDRWRPSNIKHQNQTHVTPAHSILLTGSLSTCACTCLWTTSFVGFSATAAPFSTAI